MLNIFFSISFDLLILFTLPYLCKGNPSCGNINSDDPILIHFHDVSVFILRAIPLPPYVKVTGKDDQNENISESLFISRVQGHINKVCGEFKF